MTTDGVERRAQRCRELLASESLKLLASVPLGRIAFSQSALPAIRSVNHVVDGDFVITRARLSAHPRRPTPQVVSYQADEIDPDTCLGWSVSVTGMARPVTDPDDICRYDTLLGPWTDLSSDHLLRIDATVITGVEFVAGS